MVNVVDYEYNKWNPFPGVTEEDIDTRIIEAKTNGVCVGVYWDVWNMIPEIQKRVDFWNVRGKIVNVMFFGVPHMLDNAEMSLASSLVDVDAILIDAMAALEPIPSTDLEAWLNSFNAIAKSQGLRFGYYQGDGLSAADPANVDRDVIKLTEYDASKPNLLFHPLAKWEYGNIWLNLWTNVSWRLPFFKSIHTTLDQAGFWDLVDHMWVATFDQQHIASNDTLAGMQYYMDVLSGCPPTPCPAHAAYMPEIMHPDLLTLRSFRDRCIPKKIANSYYRFSPLLTSLIIDRERRCFAVRTALKPIVNLLRRH